MACNMRQARPTSGPGPPHESTQNDDVNIHSLSTNLHKKLLNPNLLTVFPGLNPKYNIHTHIGGHENPMYGHHVAADLATSQRTAGMRAYSVCCHSLSNSGNFVATNVPGSECPTHKFMAKVGLLCQRQSLTSALFCSGCRLRPDFSFCAELMCFVSFLAVWRDIVKGTNTW